MSCPSRLLPNILAVAAALDSIYLQANAVRALPLAGVVSIKLV